MPAGLASQVLLAPLVIAATTVASLILLTGVRGPRRLMSELGYSPDPATSLSLTPARYVGGHPERARPVERPFLLLTERHLALFVRRFGPKLFAIPWSSVELVSCLDQAAMRAAAPSVRGLEPDVLLVSPPNASFVRVRFVDERGWWQNVVFELASTLAQEQARELEGFWRAHREPRIA